MAPTAQKLLPSQDDSKKKEMKRKRNEREAAEQSVERNIKLRQEKNKMGQEIEEIFRANKKKVKESPATTQAKENDKMKSGKGQKEKKEVKKKKKFPVDESSESRVKRRRTADGLTIYSAEELGIGNPDAGSTPLCPFDCSCCF